MQVCIDVSPTAQQHAGLGRYAGEIASALARQDSVDLSLFYNRQGNAQLPSYLDHLPHKTVKMGNKPWRMAVLLSQLMHWPMDVTFGAVDVFHATNHLLAHFGQAGTVFTLHDLIFLHFPEYHLPYNRWYLSFAMPRFLRAADAVVTPSECSRQDAINFYGLPAEKITVIPEAAAPGFKPATDQTRLDAVREKYNLPKRFILHVGTIEPRKNLSRLLDAFKSLLAYQPDLRLVLIGKKGWLYDEFFQKLRGLGLEEVVIFPGYVKEADLPSFFHLAEVFVYPSLYEGFGLPPLEAMACGAPVVCSNAASLPEVVGDAGLLVNPTDTKELTLALRRVLEEPDLRRRLSQQSLARASLFSWKKAAEQLKDLYLYTTKNRPQMRTAK
jgi:glycosyltransferase involved in cell wall biosynthesis